MIKATKEIDFDLVQINSMRSQRRHVAGKMKRHEDNEKISSPKQVCAYRKERAQQQQRKKKRKHTWNQINSSLTAVKLDSKVTCANPTHTQTLAPIRTDRKRFC